MAIRKTDRKKDSFRVVSSVDVIKDGIRKAHPIKKFQDSYLVGIAYVGLLELTKGRGDYGATAGEYTIDRDEYSGYTKKESPIGDIVVFARITAETRTYNKRYGKYLADTMRWSEQENFAQEYPPENLELWGENMADMVEVTCSYGLTYSFTDFQGNRREIYSNYEQNYASIEDCIDAITAESEKAWGEVSIFFDDYAREMQTYESQAEAYPDTIPIALPDGNVLTLNLEASYGKNHEGNWSGFCKFVDEDAHISSSARVRIRAVVKDDNGYYSDTGYDWKQNPYRYKVERGTPVVYYAVDVKGAITDGNTQVEDNIKSYQRPDEWERNFTGQGAETLEGAIAIAESNIAEVYQEYLDYIASAREYKVIGHGVGHRRTTENVNDWNYNFGDSYQDESYSDWQDTDVHGFDIYDNYASQSADWDYYEGFETLFKEYAGYNDYSALSYENVGDGTVRVIPRVASYYEDKRNNIMNSRTRDNAESACAMAGMQLVDYTDPLHFTVRPTNRVNMATRKSIIKALRKHVHYDVELKALRKSVKNGKPKSFNSMVKSIRHKNNQKKAI